jgi:competence protein ComEA
MAIAGLGLALLLAVVVVGRAHRPPAPLAVATPAAPAPIRVHVVGEVVWPGSYLLKAGARVQEAILAAHGPTPIADLNRVNLAAVLRDGDRVVVPRIVQPPYPFHLAPRSATLTGPTPAAATPAAGAPTPAAPPALQPRAGEPSPTVNVNTATEADLERLPGIGPVLARRIVQHRESRGLFRRLDDLLEVEGIGPKLFRRLQPLLRLD